MSADVVITAATLYANQSVPVEKFVHAASSQEESLKRVSAMLLEDPSLLEKKVDLFA